MKEDKASKSGVRVLAIDDDATFLGELKSLLEEEGYEGDYCSDSRQAMTRIAGRKPACVILDIQMAALDGHDLLGLIRARYPDIPVIVCSGSYMADTHHLFKAGASDVIRKPFTHERLFSALRSAVSEGDATPVYLEGFNFRQIHDTVSRKIILKALARTSFNVSEAARLLGISRQCLLRYIKRLQLTF